MGQAYRIFRFALRLAQGMLIGLGAVLPGISGGVLCVVFGLYRPVMDLLADPLSGWRREWRRLLPAAVGVLAGFMGVARMLSFLLENYPSQALCVFVGLIGGMLPGLFREAGRHGRKTTSYLALTAGMLAVFLVLGVLRGMNLRPAPGMGSYFFCGFCLAVSLIVPGLSFSTLLMPLGLYEPFIGGIAELDMAVVLPGAIGALLTLLALARAVKKLLDRYASIAHHAIMGVVIAATVQIIPFSAFMTKEWGMHALCIAAGAAAALGMEAAGRSAT